MSSSGLYRSSRQQMIAGVMGGIAERFGWNANLLRILFVVVSIMSAGFPGMLVYLILWIIIPKLSFKVSPRLFPRKSWFFYACCISSCRCNAAIISARLIIPTKRCCLTTAI